MLECHSCGRGGGEAGHGDELLEVRTEREPHCVKEEKKSEAKKR